MHQLTAYQKGAVSSDGDVRCVSADPVAEVGRQPADDDLIGVLVSEEVYPHTVAVLAGEFLTATRLGRIQKSIIADYERLVKRHRFFGVSRNSQNSD